MIKAYSYAKINLALKIVGKRSDGFHEICSVFQTISLCDRLTFKPRNDGRIILNCDHPSIPSDSRNLVLQAAEKLRHWAQKKSRGQGAGTGVTINLYKKIPAGAGLGGGSSNAAVTLKILCKIWNIRGLTDADMEKLAASIGSDVPFFLKGGTCLVTGRGERVKKLKPLPEFNLILIYPGFPVSTAWAYSRLKMALTKRLEYSKIMSRNTGLARGPEQMADLLCNDLEPTVLSAHRQIAQAKLALLEAGALNSLMSGSGSSVFGIFKDVVSARKAWGWLRAKWPGCYLARSVSSI